MYPKIDNAHPAANNSPEVYIQFKLFPKYKTFTTCSCLKGDGRSSHAECHSIYGEFSLNLAFDTHSKKIKSK